MAPFAILKITREKRNDCCVAFNGSTERSDVYMMGPTSYTRRQLTRRQSADEIFDILPLLHVDEKREHDVHQRSPPS